MNTLINQIVSFVVGSLLTGFLAAIKNKNKHRAVMEQGLLALLHDRLYAECERIIRKNSITKQEIDDVNHLYAAYHSLGGNGTGTRLYKEAINQKMEVEK